MFCEICQNFMDITNNVSNTKIQEGGEIIDKPDSDNAETEISDNFINEILEGIDTEQNLKNFDIANLNKNIIFNKLSNNQKTLVINRILEKLPKSSKIQKFSNITKESFNYCKTCGYYEKIKNKSCIFSRGNEKKDDSYNIKFIDYKYDNTLPSTKKYVCINDKCTTHNNPKLKSAVFFRQKDSYNIRYICSVCDSFWNTFIQK